MFGGSRRNSTHTEDPLKEALSQVQVWGYFQKRNYEQMQLHHPERNATRLSADGKHQVLYTIGPNIVVITPTQPYLPPRQGQESRGSFTLQGENATNITVNAPCNTRLASIYGCLTQGKIITGMPPGLSTFLTYRAYNANGTEQNPHELYHIIPALSPIDHPIQTIIIPILNADGAEDLFIIKRGNSGFSFYLLMSQLMEKPKKVPDHIQHLLEQMGENKPTQVKIMIPEAPTRDAVGWYLKRERLQWDQVMRARWARDTAPNDNGGSNLSQMLQRFSEQWYKDNKQEYWLEVYIKRGDNAFRLSEKFYTATASDSASGGQNFLDWNTQQLLFDARNGDNLVDQQLPAWVCQAYLNDSKNFIPKIYQDRLPSNYPLLQKQRVAALSSGTTTTIPIQQFPPSNGSTATSPLLSPHRSPHKPRGVGEVVDDMINGLDDAGGGSSGGGNYNSTVQGQADDQNEGGCDCCSCSWLTCCFGSKGGSENKQ